MLWDAGGVPRLDFTIGFPRRAAGASSLVPDMGKAGADVNRGGNLHKSPALLHVAPHPALAALAGTLLEPLACPSPATSPV